MSPVILTDYPKSSHIPACYRGLETSRLTVMLSNIETGMMGIYSEYAGGYIIDYTREGITAELKWRFSPSVST